MEASGRASGAALTLALALLALAVPGPERAPAGCPAPGALDAAPHTREVACGGAGPALRGPARALFGLGIDPNRADPATLEALPGIGPARAAAIVRERERGRFARPEELTRVPGIGPRTAARLRPWLRIAGPGLQ